MKLLKKYSGYLLLGIIEFIVYFYKPPHNLEMFFMGWGLFFFALLIYTIFNVFADGSMNAIGVEQKVLASKSKESLYKGNRNDKKEGSGFLDPANLIFLTLTAVNVVGYIVVMPK